MSRDLHIADHDQPRTTGVDGTPLLQEILCGRKRIEDQKRLVEDAEVVDIAFDRDDMLAGGTTRQMIDDQPYTRSQSANACTWLSILSNCRTLPKRGSGGGPGGYNATLFLQRR